MCEVQHSSSNCARAIADARAVQQQPAVWLAAIRSHAVGGCSASFASEDPGSFAANRAARHDLAGSILLLLPIP
jgi:hypothetical protein